MRALVKTERAAGSVKLMDVNKPEPGPFEVLIRVSAASICGSDLHAYAYDPSYHFISVPVILGHELSGVVESVGGQVDAVKPGDRVIVEANTYCGTCEHCLAGQTNICEHYRVQGLHVNGGFADYFCTHQKHVHRVPDSLDLVTASITEPLSIAVHAIYDRSNIKPGEYAAVFGPGPIGLLAAQVIRTVGAIPVLFGIDSDELSRMPAARELGIRTVNLMKQSLEDTLGDLQIAAFDHVVDCSGSGAALDSGLSVLKKGGRMTLVGLFPGRVDFDFSAVVRREVNVVGSYGCTPANYLQSLELLAEKRIAVESLHARYALEQYEDAFRDAFDKKVIKPLLMINQEE